MALVVEDGSGNPSANAYADQTFVDNYHTDRGNTYWVNLGNSAKTACIIRATDYIDKRFRQSFRGIKLTRDQALAWPRIAAFDDDKYNFDLVPLLLKKALAEYALRTAIYNVLAPDPIRVTPSQDMSAATPNQDSGTVISGPLRTKTVKVGPVETSKTYEGMRELAYLERYGGGSRSVQSNVVDDLYVPMYPEADMLIEPLLDSHELSHHLERA